MLEKRKYTLSETRRLLLSPHLSVKKSLAIMFANLSLTIYITQKAIQQRRNLRQNIIKLSRTHEVIFIRRLGGLRTKKE
ncbi:hypothetical protein KUTeg_006465 [Tegillarca granosa]|uniref:Uncharacterized protein n=1 Tax=Tegillarca granosa TaxID=220873 RepID=A0ABQ9FJV6_TEGGR|nr:hypothetical protein KUTeg_006465 [Tegillarca granosa]